MSAASAKKLREFARTVIVPFDHKFVHRYHCRDCLLKAQRDDYYRRKYANPAETRR